MGTIFFAVIIGLISLLLILNIIVQNPKGGGLNPSMSGSSNQVIGAQSTTNFLDKATWFLAIALAITTIGFNVLVRDNSGNQNLESAVEQKTIQDNLLPNLENATPVTTEETEKTPQEGTNTDKKEGK